MTASFFKSGRGRSRNAEQAEINGRFPLTRAAAELRDRAAAAGRKLTVKQAKAALAATHDNEWHHVGKFAARVNYYSVPVALIYVENESLFANLPGEGKDWARIAQHIEKFLFFSAEHGHRVIDMAAAAAALNVPRAFLAAAYHKTWSDLAADLAEDAAEAANV